MRLVCSFSVCCTSLILSSSCIFTHYDFFWSFVVFALRFLRTIEPRLKFLFWEVESRRRVFKFDIALLLELKLYDLRLTSLTTWCVKTNLNEITKKKITISEQTEERTHSLKMIWTISLAPIWLEVVGHDNGSFSTINLCRI